MGVPGLPQSATGQTSILAGVNAPAAVGRHINGYCTKSLAALLDGRSLFSRVLAAGGKATFANAYTPRYLEKPPRFLSVSTVATLRAGLRLRTLDDLARGEALFHDYTNRLLPERGYIVPAITPREAGEPLARLAHTHSFTISPVITATSRISLPAGTPGIRCQPFFGGLVPPRRQPELEASPTSLLLSCGI